MIVQVFFIMWTSPVACATFSIMFNRLLSCLVKTYQLIRATFFICTNYLPFIFILPGTP